jgi:hypothetical protein
MQVVVIQASTPDQLLPTGTIVKQPLRARHDLMLGIEWRHPILQESCCKAHFILTPLNADMKDRIPLRRLTQKDLKPSAILVNIRE